MNVRYKPSNNFDAAYFRKFYLNASTRVVTAAEMRSRAALIAGALVERLADAFTLYLAQLALSDADRFHAELLCEELDQQLNRRKRIDDKLAEFALAGSIAEQEARRVLKSIPGVAAVTTDVVLSEIGDIRRFGSQRKATAFAGLAPGIRESAGRAKHLGITKEGSRLLRWALVQTAWRLVNRTRRWSFLYNRLKQRTGAKKAIVAIARRVWCVMVAMLKSGQEYRLAPQR